MIRILTFMKIEIGKSLEVVKIIKKIPEVKEIDYITGEFDLVMILEAETSEAINHVFDDKIDQIPWIKESSSNLLIKQWKKK